MIEFQISGKPNSAGVMCVEIQAVTPEGKKFRHSDFTHSYKPDGSDKEAFAKELGERIEKLALHVL